MTGKRGGLELAARKLVLCVLFGSVLFMLWSCAGDGAATESCGAPITDRNLRPDGSAATGRAAARSSRIRKCTMSWRGCITRRRIGTRRSGTIATRWASIRRTRRLRPVWSSCSSTAARRPRPSSSPTATSNRRASSVRETLRLGWEFRQLKLDDYALRCFRQALDADPNSFEANKQIGFYYCEKNDTVKAKQYLLRSFELNPAAAGGRRTAGQARGCRRAAAGTADTSPGEAEVETSFKLEV